MAHAARALGLGVMLGCMIESGLGIAAGCAVAPLCDHVDLDGNLLIADDPWPGVAFVDGVQVPVGPAGSRCRSEPERLLILAEGFSGDPHYGKTARGVLAYGERPVVALLDSTRAGETQNGIPDRRLGQRRALLQPDDRARRRRHPGRPLPARLARAAEDGDLEGAARGERPARVPRGRRGADGPRSPARRRAARPAPATRGSERPDRREPGAAGQDRAHGRLRLRDRKDDRLARARPRGARPRARLPLRADRTDGNRDRRLGDLRRRGRLRLHRRRDRAPARRGPRARGRAADGRGPGRAHRIPRTRA